MLKSKVKHITRTFFPVGQGAFFKERLVLDNNKVFNIVYDCGTSTPCGNDNITKILSDWNYDEIVDILFISHFHEDHISRIPDLIHKTKPKMIIMPYLTDDEKKYYEIGVIDSIISNQQIKYKEEMKEKVINEIIFIENPKDYLRNKTNADIAFIVKEKDIENIKKDIKVIQEGNLLERKLDVLKEIDDHWVFDTFVSPHIDRQRIINEFNNRIINISKILKNPNKLEEILNDSNKKKEIKKIYGKKMNETSLVLYSGTATFIKNCYIKTENSYRHNLSGRNGCLYTGDYNAKNREYYEEFKNHFQAYYKNINCLQLPHHGSNNSFNDDFLNIKCDYIACVGENNTYNHPGNKVINKILGANKRLRIVTENSSKVEYRIRVN